MAEALWADEIRERTLAERVVIGARLAQAEEWDSDLLPDVDLAMQKWSEWLNGDGSLEPLTPEDERRLAVGLGRKG